MTSQKGLHENYPELDSSKDYPFILSTEEFARLNEQSLGLNELMHGNISLAPVKNPTKILDIGCGTGIQTCLLAASYPDAQVIGVDPNPVPHIHSKPSNVEFVLGRIEDVDGKHKLLQPSSFDLVYARYLIMVIKDWRDHVRRIRELLKPAGWVEFHEFNMCQVYNEDDQIVSNGWRFLEIFKRGGVDRGLDFEIGNRLPAICSDLGFIDICLRKFPQTYRSGWMAKPETERSGAYFERTLPIFLHPMLERSVRPNEGEDLGEVYREAKEKLLDGPIGLHSDFNVIIARKPIE